MATSLTGINDVKVVTKCLNALNLALTPLRVFSLNVGSDPAEKNDTVRVPVHTALTANTNATNYEVSNTTVATANVSIDTNLSKSWSISAVEASKTTTDVFESSAVEAVYAVAYAAQLALFNKIVRASFGTSTEQAIASTAFDSDALLDGRNTVLNTLKWRANDQVSVVLDGAYYANLLKDPAIKDMSASGVSAGVDGMVAKFAGMSLFENGVIASSTPYGATEYLRGFYCLPRSIACAIRPPAKIDSGSFEANEIISDPETGVAMNYRTWVNTQTNTKWGCVEILFGAVKCDSNALYRIVSQASS